MSNVGLFVAGTLVTLVVAAALGLLFWGAFLDGADEHARHANDEPKPEPTPPALRVIDAA